MTDEQAAALLAALQALITTIGQGNEAIVAKLEDLDRSVSSLNTDVNRLRDESNR